MSKTKITLIVIASFIGLIGLSWGLEYLNIIRLGIFKPMRENVEREVFENTQSYVEGKRQEALKYRLEYMRADSADKVALQMVIVQSFANFDEEKLPLTLRNFIYDLKYGNNSVF